MNKIEIRNDCVIGVSGGADSMFLLHHFKNASNIHVVHVNYNIRADSHEDTKLVTEYCKQYDIPLHVKYIDAPPTSNVEAWARDIRYDFYREILSTYNLKQIVTAHNANDQVETLFIRIHRGTTIKGLACIYRDSNELYRPLLDWRKSDIYSECNRLGIPYREDSTNLDINYLRNWFRHNIDTDSYVNTVLSICDRVQRIVPMLNDITTRLYAETVKFSEGNLYISKTLVPDTILYFHLNNILAGKLSLTESVFTRIFSDAPSAHYFDIKKNIKCNKRKKHWIIIQFT